MPETAALPPDAQASLSSPAAAGITHVWPSDAGVASALTPSTSATRPTIAVRSAAAGPHAASRTNATGTTSTGPLAGVRVLLGRERARDPFATALEAAGADVTRCALTATVPGDAAALASARAELLSGRFDWLVVTSARTLRFLDVTGLPASVRTAAVGPATVSALQRATGRTPDVTGTADAEALLALLTPPESGLQPGQAARPEEPAPRAGASAQPAADTSARPAPGAGSSQPGSSHTLPDPDLSPTMISEPGDSLPAAHGAYVQPGERVLLPASAIARPVLAEGLTGLGAEVTRLDAYSTATTAPDTVPPEVRRDWAEGSYDVVIVTAASSVRAAAALLGRLPEGCGVVVLGQPSATAVRETGLLAGGKNRLAIAPSPDAAGVTAAVRDLLGARAAAPPRMQGAAPDRPQPADA